MNEEEYFEYLNKQWLDNLPALIEIANKTCWGTQYNQNELLNFYYVWLSNNPSKISDLEEMDIQDGYSATPFSRFSGKWLHDNVKRFSANEGKSNFNSIFEPKKELSIDFLFDETKTPVEELNTEEHEKWLVENFSDDVIEKLNLLEFIVENELSPLQKKLYELHFIKGYKPKQLRVIFPDIKSHSFNKMFDEMKQVIKTKADEYEKE